VATLYGGGDERSHAILTSVVRRRVHDRAGWHGDSDQRQLIVVDRHASRMYRSGNAPDMRLTHVSTPAASAEDQHRLRRRMAHRQAVAAKRIPPADYPVGCGGQSGQHPVGPSRWIGTSQDHSTRQPLPARALDFISRR
jgi:hypothetical protein